MNSHIFDMIRKYTAELAEIDGDVLKVFMKLDGRIYAIADDADLTDLQQSDIVVLEEGRHPYSLERNLLAESSSFRALILSKTPFCMEANRRGLKLIPAVDDMAQIVGPQAETVPDTESEIRRALQISTCCFVRGRCTISAGRSLFEAAVALQVLEKSAEISIKAEVIGGPAAVSEQEAKKMQQTYQQNYSKAEAEAKAEEWETGEITEPETSGENFSAAKKADFTHLERQLREELVLYGRKLVETGLVQGTWGNLSVRLDDRFMLTTPSGLDYMRLTPENMVKVDIQSLDYAGSLKPTSEKGIHSGVYQNREDVGAVIHTHSKYCSIFAAARKDVPVKAGDVRRDFGTSVKLGDYALPGTESLWENTIAALGENKGCIMANHGMLCVGRTLEEAFGNCWKLEEYCRQYIDSRYEGR